MNTKEDTERSHYSIFYPECFKFYYLDVTCATLESLLLLWGCGRGSTRALTSTSDMLRT